MQYTTSGYKESGVSFKDYHITRLTPIKNGDALPTTFKLTYGGKIKNQNPYNTCVPNSCAYCREIVEQTQSGAYKQFSVGYVYANRPDANDVGEGMYTRTALECLRLYGDVPYAFFPYDNTYDTVKPLFDRNPAEYNQYAGNYKISAYCRIDLNATDFVNQIKTALTSLGPVTIGLYVYSSFFVNVPGLGPNIGVVPIPDTTNETSYGGHALTIVGWRSDNKWICLNSWGNTWGDKGYCYLPFDYPLNEAWSLTDNILPQPAAQVPAITISGTKTVGNILTATHTYSHPSSVAEGTSKTEWFRDMQKVGEANTYTLTENDGGHTMQVIVTPVDINGVVGNANMTDLGTIPPTANQAPVAAQVNIVLVSGTSAEPGSQLQGNYTYSDADGDVEGTSTYKWYRNGVVIDGQTTKTYTIVDADRGLPLKFEVTPVDSKGKAGVTVQSSEYNIPKNDRAPVADFTVNATGSINAKIVVTNASTDPDNDVLAYNWGAYDTIIKKYGKLYFNTPGSYTITLTATDPTGLQGIANKTITISGLAARTQSYHVLVESTGSRLVAKALCTKLIQAGFDSTIIVLYNGHFCCQAWNTTDLNSANNLINQLSAAGFQATRVFY